MNDSEVAAPMSITDAVLAGIYPPFVANDA
jgi:hypothetical protein